MNIGHRRRRAVTAALAAILLLTGCALFKERAFPVRSGDVVRVPAEELQRISTREWIVRAHNDLQNLLPEEDHQALLTQDMSAPDGQAIDVINYFGRMHKKKGTFFGNWNGLVHTAQTVGATTPLDYHEPPWPGFEPVWIPVSETLSLHGDLGLARDAAGKPLRTDCIVIMPGFLGDNSIRRTRDLAEALVRGGFHALALEPRGHGTTEMRYPKEHYTWYVLETGDLLQVSEWLERRPDVRSTGLVGFCWSSNCALLEAWFDGGGIDDPGVPPRLRSYLYRSEGRTHFASGIIAFSPVLNFESVIDQLETPQTLLGNPPLAGIQDSVQNRMVRKGFASPSGSLRTLIRDEISSLPNGYPEAVDDGLDFLRLIPYKNLVPRPKLEAARVPVLIVHGANDPLTYAQEVADLMCTIHNPNVAAIILPGGGHIGFAAYARSYYYSLIMNFFDQRRGAAAAKAGMAAQPALAHGEDGSTMPDSPNSSPAAESPDGSR